MKIIFLDIDGVLNCQVFYDKRVNDGSIIESPLRNICTERVGWLNELCAETGAKVVLSSSWRYSGLEYCKQVLTDAGATFEIIDVTPKCKGDGSVTGNEIYLWLQKNINLETHGCYYYDFRNYVIVDDDSDMLLWQREHFFQTDTYSGLTPNTCYKIKRFFNKMNNEAKDNRSVASKADQGTKAG